MNIEQNVFAGETIPYGYRLAGAGLAIIAVSDRGVVAVLLGSNRGDLHRKLMEALPGATLADDESTITEKLDEVLSCISDPIAPTVLRLDMRGDAAQLAVWNALRVIPVGETRSYGALAKTIGVGLTAQEVGAACAANRLAVVVPCHRILKADGSISGYRWGVPLKRRLLAQEKAA